MQEAVHLFTDTWQRSEAASGEEPQLWAAEVIWTCMSRILPVQPEQSFRPTFADTSCPLTLLPLSLQLGNLTFSISSVLSPGRAFPVTCTQVNYSVTQFPVSCNSGGLWRFPLVYAVCSFYTSTFISSTQFSGLNFPKALGDRHLLRYSNYAFFYLEQIQET